MDQFVVELFDEIKRHLGSLSWWLWSLPSEHPIFTDLTNGSGTKLISLKSTFNCQVAALTKSYKLISCPCTYTLTAESLVGSSADRTVCRPPVAYILISCHDGKEPPQRDTDPDNGTARQINESHLKLRNWCLHWAKFNLWTQLHCKKQEYFWLSFSDHLLFKC